MKHINKKQFEKNGVLWWHCKKYAKEFSEYDERITVGSIYTTYCELNRKIKNNKNLTEREQRIFDCFKKIDGLLFISDKYLNAKYGTINKLALEKAYYQAMEYYNNEHKLSIDIWDKIKDKQYITQNGKYRGHPITQKTIYMYFRHFIFACEYYNQVFTEAINQLLEDRK